MSTGTQERLFAGYEGRMLGSLSVAWAVLQAGRFLFSPLLPAIIADLGITKATAGLALGAFQVVYAATQYPSGRFSDRWGRAALVLPGLATLALAFVVVGAATTYAVFVAGVVLVGVGKGLFAPPSRALLSDLFVSNRGRALGLYTAGTDVGGVLASGLAVAALAVATWRAPFVPVAVVLAAATLLYVLWNDEPYRVERADLELGATVRRLATTREQRETLVAYALFFFFVGGFINFLPTYLAEAKGASGTLASAGFALVFVTGAVTKPVSGALSDRLPRRTVAVAGLLLALLALAALVVAGSPVVVAAAVVALALGYKTQFPIVDALLLDAAPDENAGGDLGAARALFLGVGALGPAFVGVTATAAGYPAAFAGLGACLLGAAGILLAQRRRGP